MGYNKRVWLNKDDSPSVGNMVAFDGDITWKGEAIPSTFLSISDCSVSIRLHKCDDDSDQDFIDKMKLLRDEVNLFVNYLESKDNE